MHRDLQPMATKFIDMLRLFKTLDDACNLGNEANDSDVLKCLDYKHTYE
jgi:hypothetical protein